MISDQNGIHFKLFFVSTLVSKFLRGVTFIPPLCLFWSEYYFFLPCIDMTFLCILTSKIKKGPIIIFGYNLKIPPTVFCRSLKAGYSCWTRLEGFWEGQKNDASINFRINFIHLIPKRSFLSDQLLSGLFQADYINLDRFLHSCFSERIFPFIYR